MAGYRTLCILFALLIFSTCCGAGDKVVFPDTDWIEASPESQGVDSRKLTEAGADFGFVFDQ